jgi:hypothetical protein
LLIVLADQTPKSGEHRVYKHLGDEAESLLQGRARLINIWRPLRGPVLDNPLAVADYRSIDPQNDLVPSELRYENGFVGETFVVKYNPNQRFYYVSEMQPDEVLLLKCWDNKVGVCRVFRLLHPALIETIQSLAGPGVPPSKSELASLTPHTAFVDERYDGKEGVPRRESIEVCFLSA